MDDDIFTQILDMDPMVTEQVVRNVDGTYTIFLNAKLSWERIMLAYYHARKHILNNDFEKTNVDNIETNAHAL